MGQAASFGAYYSSPHIDVYGKSDPANHPFTMAAWFKTDDNTHNLTAIHGAGNDSNDVVSLTVAGGKPSALLYESGSVPSHNHLTHSTSLADGQWHQMVVSFTGGSDDTLRLFVDGRLSGLQTQSADNFTISGWSVGSEYGGSNYFGGSMDDVRMYNRALSDGGVSVIGQTAGGDVAELYSLGVPEPGTITLLAIGSLGLLAFTWRKRRRR